MFARHPVGAGLYLAIGLVGASMTVSTVADAQVLEGNLFLRQEQATLGYVNQVFGDFPTFSTGMGSMVTTTAVWDVSNVQIYLIAGGSPNTWYGNVNTAVLNVSRQEFGSPSASVDPALATNTGAPVVYSGLVSVVLDQGIDGNQKFRMMADTTAIPQLQGLAAGDYVFSLTGMADNGTFGQAFTASAGTLEAQEDWIRNAGEGFGITANWRTLPDALGAAVGTKWAIGINGAVVPEPASLIGLVAGFGALLASRRRKRSR
ncbi:MAG: PEP-CTERM sorting domain-containing protein [Fimbriimonadaceae bacterium]|nr:PEP-CTERM sorting domain-containing protein [Fimbriimonadaceae bacterium]